MMMPHYAPMPDMHSYPKMMMPQRPQTTGSLVMRNQTHRRPDAGAPYSYARDDSGTAALNITPSFYEGSDDQIPESSQSRAMLRYSDSHLGPNLNYTASRANSCDENLSLQAGASPHYSSAMPGSPSPSLSSNFVASAPASPVSGHASISGLDYDDTWKKTSANVPLHYRASLPHVPGPSYSTTSLKRSSLSQVWSNPSEQKDTANSSW